MWQSWAGVEGQPQAEPRQASKCRPLTEVPTERQRTCTADRGTTWVTSQMTLPLSISSEDTFSLCSGCPHCSTKEGAIAMRGWEVQGAAVEQGQGQLPGRLVICGHMPLRWPPDRNSPQQPTMALACMMASLARLSKSRMRERLGCMLNSVSTHSNLRQGPEQAGSRAK